MGAEEMTVIIHTVTAKHFEIIARQWTNGQLSNARGRKTGIRYWHISNLYDETTKRTNIVAGRVHVHVSADWSGSFRRTWIGNRKQTMGFFIEWVWEGFAFVNDRHKSFTNKYLFWLQRDFLIICEIGVFPYTFLDHMNCWTGHIHIHTL